jgi:cytochrome b
VKIESSGYQKVWSPFVRLLHWTLALSMIIAFVTHENGGRTHEVIGYVALAAATLRLLLGIAGSGAWRFSAFVRSASVTFNYARAVLQKKERRYLGHNPLGAWMVVALLADALATGFTGWLYTTDRFWGVKWVEDVHGVLGEALIPLLVMHIGGAIFTSIRHKENLVMAMVHGKKPCASPNDL